MNQSPWTPYPQYKDSGVEWLGEVPEHWEVKRLRFVAEINPSKIEVAQLDRRTEVSFLAMELIGEDGTLTLDRSRPIDEVESGYTYFREDDVVIAKITPCFENGKGAIMRGLLGGIGFGTTELIVFRPKEGKTTSEYLNLILLSSPFRKLGESEMYGAGGQKRIPEDFVRNFSIAFPPLKEQISISSFLDRETSRIDTLISEKERLISLLQEYRQALISHAVTKGLDPKVKMKDSGVEWLGEVPEHWEVKRLKHIANVRLSNVDKHTVEGQKVVRLCNYLDVYNHRNITSKIDFMSATASDEQIERLSLQKDDVIITKDSEDPSDIGIPALIAEDIFGLVCGYHLAILRPTASNGEYLYYLLQSTFVRSAFEIEATGMTRYALGKYSIENLAFALPNQSEQTSISSFLDRKTSHIDTLISKAQKFIDLLKEYRSSLITAAVTGKIAVREVVPSGSEKRDIVHE